MLRRLLWVLRQKRYAALALCMALLGVGCAAAGTFEIHRLGQKRSDNARLIANARSAVVPLTRALVPVTGSDRPVDALAVRYRTVAATGRYDAAAQEFVGNQSQDGAEGFWVLTPLRSASGTLLVARGFVAATAAGTPPARVAAPPAGSVRVTGRLQTASGGANRVGDGVTAVDPPQEAQRLGVPVYQAYLALDAGQPGTDALRALPGPTLSNPTGGAAEWQLMSYVVQWYVFAALALAAPFLFARAEIRAARRRFLGLNPDADDWDRRRIAAPGTAALDPAPAGTGRADLAIRSGGTVARLSDIDPRVRRRAMRLADRYGLSLGPDVDFAGDPAARPDPEQPVASASPRRRIGGVPDLPDRTPGTPARTTAGLSRSPDSYHGSYNDYLWELALADGEAPDLALLGDPKTAPSAKPVSDADSTGDASERRTIDGVVADRDQDGDDR